MKKQSITRRDLLKVLAAAGGGITAAAFLPAQWVKPIVNSGVLPVHAQASGYGRLWGTTEPFGVVNFYISSQTMKTGLKSAKPKSQALKMGIDASPDRSPLSTTADADGYFSKDLLPETYHAQQGDMGCESSDYTLHAGDTLEVEWQPCG